MNNLVCSVPEAGAILGLNRDGSYRSMKLGYIPTVKTGQRHRVVAISALAEMLGVSQEDVVAQIATNNGGKNGGQI